VRKRFPPPTSLKKFEDVLQEELYAILVDSVQNLNKTIPRGTAAVPKAKVAQHHINKVMCSVSVAFPLFCPVWNGCIKCN
jgi:hypothetical protein